jgi:hypothetical protein
MNVPDISHLQFLVLELIGARKITGRELREMLAKRGVKKSGPAFYQLMGRLEDAKFVSGSFTKKFVEGQLIRERVYSVTGAGERAFNGTIDFYERSEGKEAFA